MRTWLVPTLALPLALPLPALASVHIGVAAYPTLADAITNAVAGDTLVLDPGVYVEAIYVDKSLSIVGAGAATITFDGVSSAVITLDRAVSLTLTGVTVTSTSVPGIYGPTANELIVADTTFRTRSLGYHGGGVFITGPTAVSLTNVVFDGTTAAFEGGGIFVGGVGFTPVTLTDVDFLSTSAGLASDGGGVWVSNAELQCTRCNFVGTSAQDGGAVYDNGSSGLTFVDSTFSATDATGNGGAIRVGALSTATVTDSTFTGTNADDGGAIHASSAIMVRGSLFCDTAAPSGDGGAIFGSAGGTVENNRFVAGSAFGGAAVYGVTGGTWVVANDTVIDAVGDAFDFSGVGVTVDMRNVAVTGTSGFAVNASGTNVAFLDNNLYDQNSSGNVLGSPAGANNVQAPPDYVAYSADGDCDNDQLWPSPTSPLLDAGFTGFFDTDGSRSDIGAYGGPGADPLIHDDGDGDGVIFLFDCDDADDTSYPGGIEVCDTSDNDCDGAADDDPIDLDTWYPDCDGDGQGAPDEGVEQCFDPAVGCPWLSDAAVGLDASSDCDDGDPATYNGAPETCFPGDQNCDGDDDLGAIDPSDLYIDLDGDGWGDVYDPRCGVPPQHVEQGGDCDDVRRDVYPGALDACGDGVDQDCDGSDGDATSRQDWYPDDDGDGFGDPASVPDLDCADRSATHTLLADATDCDDGDDAVNPGATEICNDLDDDCDEVLDDAGPVVTWFEDLDADGFGNDLVDATAACSPDGRWVTTPGDCNDADNAIGPDASEVCNGLDDDCDGQVDDGGGCDSTPVAPDPKATPAGEDDGGCSCATGAPPVGGLFALALVLFVRRRAGP